MNNSFNTFDTKDVGFSVFCCGTVAHVPAE